MNAALSESVSKIFRQSWREVSMTGRTTYDKQLRTIGQSLEAQRIQLFELTRQGERYVVKGEPEKETSLLATLRQWQKRVRAEGVNTSLTFTSPDLDQLDNQGCANRAKTNQLSDFHRLPNTLRTVGAYLELNGAELIELHKKELSVTILSRNQAGHPKLEERSVASLYDIFVRLHGRRAEKMRS
jgi:hypothetical protein